MFFPLLLMCAFQAKTKRRMRIYSRLYNQPDLCIICDAQKLDERGCKGAPDLIVEILSPGNSKREMRDKFEIYEEAGVREYWLVNPSEKTVLIYLLGEQGRFMGLQPLTEDQIAKAVIFPELEIGLKELFNPVA